MGRSGAWRLLGGFGPVPESPCSLDILMTLITLANPMGLGIKCATGQQCLTPDVCLANGVVTQPLL